ncbi:hypothetical protein AABB24_033523 [Solanum stoloniferum]|uniref:Uncharacterized protein n=1 Tax=Solanum stoloniferum TaxID=62892 RepID=A0ABD2RQ58_9SOLN
MLVLGVNDHDSEQKASGNQESGGVENAEEEFRLDLAILISLLDSKISRQSKSTDKHILSVKSSFPDLKFSRNDMEDKINSLEKRFKKTREMQGDSPKMVRRIEREIIRLVHDTMGMPIIPR